MIYTRIYGFAGFAGKDKADLIKQNPEYDEINEVLADYETCLNIQERYFSDESAFNENDPEFKDVIYDYNLEKAKKCAEFMLNWEHKRKKILARMKKNSYFTKTSRLKDNSDLKYGDRKFDDLLLFSELNDKFESLGKVLSPNSNHVDAVVTEHVRELYRKRKAIEEEYVKTKKDEKASVGAQPSSN